MNNQPNRHGVVVSALLVALLLVGVYVGGFFWSSKAYTPGSLPLPTLRVFESRFAYEIYSPMGWIESTLRRTEVTHCRPFEPGDPTANKALDHAAKKGYTPERKFKP